MRSPKQLRTEIYALRHSVEQIRDVLTQKIQNVNEPTWGIGADCGRTAQALSSLLANQIVPDSYKVAVVGRFKAGKSSFVNELLGARLAGEDTSPETAAVTTFRHGPIVKATIRFIDQAAWQGIKHLYAEEPKHIDAHRVKMWNSFTDKPRRNSDGQIVEVFDLNALEHRYVKPGGYSMEICLDHPDDKRAENEFRRKLKEFTSGARPHHCLVEQIEITSPASILDEGVLLIDTPGLDDTERFRVTLTEKAVEDVDAVLFLTKSGAAYGQSEKDFLLTLLRKGTVKQLIFVITQVDQTYEQHLRNADANDEDPETISARIKREEQRIREEIDATLTELSAEDSPAMRRYREQLGDVGLAFTSAANHRDWKANKPVEHKIHPDDPGGIERMKRQLLQLLSTESRLALTAHNIASGAKAALDELQVIITNRRAAVRLLKNGEVAEQKLATFREEFASAKQRFQSAAVDQAATLTKDLEARRKQNALFIETITLLAERELAAFETDDAGRHWRTRRSGNWGYMYGLQSRVANKIFPKVQQLLSELTEQFSVFIDRFEQHLLALSQASTGIADRLELGATISFDPSRTLKGSLEKSLETAGELIAAEEQKVVAFLHDFVSAEVEEKISNARDRVSHIWGRGTTAGQSHEVRGFYTEVKRLLQEALTTHLEARCAAFSSFLTTEAAGVPRRALSEIEAMLDNAEADIQAATTAMLDGKREAFERESDEITAAMHPAIDGCTGLLETIENKEDFSATDAKTRPQAPSLPTPSTTSAHADPAQVGWVTTVQGSATETLERLRLHEGDTGWPMEKIFRPDLLTDCRHVVLIDPYLTKPHQIRNLKEFLLAVAEAAKPKEITVWTSLTWSDAPPPQARAIDDVAQDLFKNYGAALIVKTDPAIHDRYVVCDNGTLFKLGRGLDFYKPATGLASHRPGNRRVRRTEIDVFITPERRASAPSAR